MTLASSSVPFVVHTLENCIEDLQKKQAEALRQRGIEKESLIIERFFCSDVYTQAPILEKLWPREKCVLRQYIGQIPLDSLYISYQAYALSDAQNALQKENIQGGLLVKHGEYQSFWKEYLPSKQENSEKQSDEIIARAILDMNALAMNFKDNVLRTWYYIRDVDNNYLGMIASRTRQYEKIDLSPKTHFIASTGIEACMPMPHALSGLVLHAEKNVQGKQIEFIEALEHLSPTHIYGVNFERATTIEYGDRKHFRLSGTASIDKLGNVVHVGDVQKQAYRTIENIEALLCSANMTLHHMKSIIVYLRDGHDFLQITNIIEKSFLKDCAVNIVQGAVCRPDWLIEIEGEAVCEQENRDFAPF